MFKSTNVVVKIKIVSSNVYNDGRNNSIKAEVFNESGVLVGYVDCTVVARYKSIFIDRFKILEDYRRKGYGTALVYELQKMYKGYYFSGDILYPVAYDFWVKFDKRLLECDPESPDLTFEFKS